jgi:hypothetical protein
MPVRGQRAAIENVVSTNMACSLHYRMQEISLAFCDILEKKSRGDFRLALERLYLRTDKLTAVIWKEKEADDHEW